MEFDKMKHSIIGLLALSAACGVACGSTATVDEEEHLGTATQPLTFATFTADTSRQRAGTTVTVNTGFGSAGSTGGVYRPGFCFFVAIRGSLAGKGDRVEIQQDINGQFVLTAANTFSGTAGPKATIGCINVTDIGNASGPYTNAGWTSNLVGPATVDLATTSSQVDVPDVLGGATPLPATSINILSGINGRIDAGPGIDKSSFYTGTNFQSSVIGAVFSRHTGTGQECNPTVGYDSRCFLSSFGWTNAYVT